MLTIRKTIAAVFTCVILFASCSKTDENITPVDSNEALTTIQLKLVNNADAADSITATIKVSAVMGEIIDTTKALLHLKAHAEYSSKVVLLDTTQTPAFDATLEIKERANEHLFFYQPTPIADSVFVIGVTSPYIPGTATSATGPYLNLTIQRTDYDTSNPPLQVGLKAIFTTGSASTGRLHVVLRHQPNAKNGQYAPGSTDLDVNFQVEVY